MKVLVALTILLAIAVVAHAEDHHSQHHEAYHPKPHGAEIHSLRPKLSKSLTKAVAEVNSNINTQIDANTANYRAKVVMLNNEMRTLRKASRKFKRSKKAAQGVRFRAKTAIAEKRADIIQFDRLINQLNAVIAGGSNSVVAAKVEAKVARVLKRHAQAGLKRAAAKVGRKLKSTKVAKKIQRTIKKLKKHLKQQKLKKHLKHMTKKHTLLETTPVPTPEQAKAATAEADAEMKAFKTKVEAAKRDVKTAAEAHSLAMAAENKHNLARLNFLKKLSAKLILKAQTRDRRALDKIRRLSSARREVRTLIKMVKAVRQGVTKNYRGNQSFFRKSQDSISKAGTTAKLGAL